jgi:hypothetical protein
MRIQPLTRRSASFGPRSVCPARPRDLIVQTEGAVVHVGRADHAGDVVDGEELGVQHRGLGVEVDADAGV